MKAKNPLVQTLKFIPVLLLLAILSSASRGGIVHALVTSKIDGFSPRLDLDEDASMWGVFIEGSPIWALNNVVSPSLDGRSLRCAITGGNPYSNVHCFRDLAADPASNLFASSMSFFYQPDRLCNGITSIQVRLNGVIGAERPRADL